LQEKRALTLLSLCLSLTYTHAFQEAVPQKVQKKKPLTPRMLADEAATLLKSATRSGGVGGLGFGI
jgi:hypothetical protein